MMNDTGCGCPPKVYWGNYQQYFHECAFAFNLSEGGNITIDQDRLQYGNSCNYLLTSMCGYPEVKVEGQDLDIVYGYFSEPSAQVQAHGNVTTWVPGGLKVGETWRLPQSFKADGPFNVTANTSQCVNTTVFVSVTNLHKTTTQARSL